MMINLSRTQQIEIKYGVRLKRTNYDGFFVYDIYDNQGNYIACEWLETLDDVEKYLKENKTEEI